MTTVLNILGGSGVGKSTLAAGLFSQMKSEGKSVELVTEYVKQWAWKGHKITTLDQPLIFGRQSNLEANLYGKVDFIITDSPLLISPIYEKFYNGDSIVEEAVYKFMAKAESKGVKYYNFFLARHKQFDPRGRYETEEQAKAVDEFMLKELSKQDRPIVHLYCPDSERINYVLEYLGESKKDAIQKPGPESQVL